jgi:hypothetical protein
MKINKKNLKKINNWASKRGFTIHWGDSDYVLPLLGEIHIKSNKYELYSLLHECGHISLFDKNSYSKKYKVLEMAESNGHLKKTNLYKYQKMREEISAWEVGYKLSKKLKIKVDKKEYFNEAAKWVGTYRRLL